MDLSGRPVDHLHGVTGEVDEDLLARGVNLAHRRLQATDPFAVKVAEPRIAELVLASRPSTVFFPEQRQPMFGRRNSRCFEGVVTAPDVLEAIVGEPGDAAARQAEPGLDGEATLVMDGMMPVDEVKSRLGLLDLPAEASYHTLGGLILALLRRLPSPGDRIVFAGWPFEVMDMDAAVSIAAAPAWSPPRRRDTQPARRRNSQWALVYTESGH